MAGEIDWRYLPINQPNLSPLLQAQQMVNGSVNSIGDAFKQLGTDFRNQNTNSALAQIAGMNSMDALGNGRDDITNILAQKGTGIDALRVLGALDTRQQTLGDQEMQGMRLADARGNNGDRELNNQVNALVAQGKLQEASALASGLYNNSGALSRIGQREDFVDNRDYTRGRDTINDNFRKAEFDLQKKNADRNYDLATSSAAMELSKYLNPDAGQTTTEAVQNADGSWEMVSKENPSAAQSYVGLRDNLRTYGGSSGAVISKAVNSNLKEFSANMAKKGNENYGSLMGNDPRVMAMMAIESGGKGMGTTSYDGSSVGPMQLNKKYAAGLAKQYGIKGDPLTNEAANIQTGTAHMNALMKTYKGDLEKASAAYNGGEGTVNSAVSRWEKAGKKGHWLDYLGNKDPKQVRDHVAKYMGAFTSMTGTGQLSNTASIGAGNRTATAQSAPIRVDGKAMAGALQSYQTALASDGLLTNATKSKADKLADVAALDDFKSKNGIGTGMFGSTSGKGIFGNDANDIYNAVKDDPTFKKQGASNQLLIMQSLIAKNKAEEMPIFGKNISDSSLRAKSQQYGRQLVAEAQDEINNKKFQHLASAAKATQDNMAKGGKAPPPLEAIMSLIDPQLYKELKGKSGSPTNPK